MNICTSKCSVVFPAKPQIGPALSVFPCYIAVRTSRSGILRICSDVAQNILLCSTSVGERNLPDRSPPLYVDLFGPWRTRKTQAGPVRFGWTINTCQPIVKILRSPTNNNNAIQEAPVQDKHINDSPSSQSAELIADEDHLLN